MVRGLQGRAIMVEGHDAGKLLSPQQPGAQRVRTNQGEEGAKDRILLKAHFL